MTVMMLLAGLLGYIFTLSENRRARRVLRILCDTCSRCEGSGAISYYDAYHIDCPRCVDARKALRLHTLGTKAHPKALA